MANLNSLLQERTKQSQGNAKMKAMAFQSASGNLSGFTGIFGVSELSSKEKETLTEILNNYALSDDDLEADLQTLISITSEVKAINNQAAILHGERIKKAHQILTQYRDGAFTAWLIATYGNRQTPYNLMQYYEFYEAMPKDLRPKIELMPRQAVYVLASREGELEEKEKIVKNYQGETKVEVIALIRRIFPLASDDKRKEKVEDQFLVNLEKLSRVLKQKSHRFSKNQKEQIHSQLQYISKHLGFS